MLTTFLRSNVAKEKAIEHLMMTEKGTACKSLSFINKPIATQWILYDEIGVMDNAKIHIGGDAAMVKPLLWNTVIPLHCAVQVSTSFTSL